MKREVVAFPKLQKDGRFTWISPSHRVSFSFKLAMKNTQGQTGERKGALDASASRFNFKRTRTRTAFDGRNFWKKEMY